MSFFSRATTVITALLLGITTLAAQNVTLNMSQAKLGAVLDAIEKQTGCSFNYTQPPVDLQKTVSLNVKGESLESAVKKLFAGTQIEVYVSGSNVYLTSKEKSQSAPTQYKGKVVDNEGMPIIGAAVLLKGTTSGSITDFDGNFSVSAPKGALVEVSTLGFISKTVMLGDAKELKIVLSPEVTQLDDVVVVGYSTSSRQKLISSVSSLKGNQLVKADVPNLENALSGRVSGVFSRQTSAEPGKDAANLTIRGFGAALVVVDGIPGRSYSDLDPNEIESVSVLKDASAAAVYGMQGANGVILVTTKRGMRNKPVNVEVLAKYSLQQAMNYPKTASSELYQTLLNEYTVNRQLIADRTYIATDAQMQITPSAIDTNWYDEMFRIAPSSQANLNISGGSEKVNYFISGGFLNQQGLWSANSTAKNRFNVRSNLDIDLAKGLKASLGLGAVILDLKYPYYSSSSIARYVSKASPLMPVKWRPDDKLYAYTGENCVNPMALTDPDATGSKTSKEHTFTVDAALEYKLPFIEGMSLKANLGYTHTDTYARDWGMQQCYIGYYPGSGEYYYSPSCDYADKADLTVSNTNYNNLVFQGMLNYKNTFDGHTFNGGLVFEANTSSKHYFYTKRTAYPSTVADRLNAGLSGANIEDGETIRNYHSLSFVERFSYDYESRYFVDINTRVDGAQFFSKKWGVFPSVSLGWFLTNEPFMEGHKNVLKELKVRASYGTLGDLSAAKAYYDANEMYYYQAGYEYPGGEMTFGDRTLIALRQTINANKDFTWSTSTIANIGVDFKLFENDLLSGSLDLFYRSRKGLPAIMANDNSGALKTYYNINSDNTRGIELSLNHANHIGEFNYNVGVNMSWSRSKNGHVEHVEYPSGYSDWVNNVAGRWSNIRWGYHCIGRYESYEEIDAAPIHLNADNNTIILPGDLKYEDVNQDGYIDSKDMMPIGRTAYPELMYGINLGASWRNFDLSIFLQGAALCQFTISQYDMFAFENGHTTDNCWAYFGDRWHKEDYTNPSSRWIAGHFPAIRDWADNTINTYMSDFWMINGSYIRMKNVELGYTFKFKGSDKSSLRLYLAAYNPFTISHQKYFDPEIPDGQAYSFAAYPQTRTYIAGINLKF